MVTIVRNALRQSPSVKVEFVPTDAQSREALLVYRPGFVEDSVVRVKLP